MDNTIIKTIVAEDLREGLATLVNFTDGFRQLEIDLSEQTSAVERGHSNAGI